MDVVSLCLSLTPHGRLVLIQDADAPRLDSGLADRLLPAFERGSGHGLLLLGVDEAGTALSPLHSYWREFGARYVTALCTQQDSDASRKGVRVAAPPDDELESMTLAAPPMIGAEYLTSSVLAALWHISYIFCHKIHHCTDYIIEVNPRHAVFYNRMLGGFRHFDRFLVRNNATPRDRDDDRR